MKKLILFISLLCFSLPTLSICKYSKTSNPTVGISIKSKILSDKSLPAGSILGVGTVGGGVADMKTFYDCEAGDVYAVSASPGAIEAPGVKGIQGGTVYETGIKGIGYQISDAISGSNIRPIPAKMGSISAYRLTVNPVVQLTAWLIKTNDDIDTNVTSSRTISVMYLAGTPTQVQSRSSTARLLGANLTLGAFTFRETSCEVTPRNGSTIKLPNIEASQLNAVTPGNATGKQKDIILDINCPTLSVGSKYTYWFNPITPNSSSTNGVLMNSVPVASGGAQDVGLIIKKDGTAIKFYDYDAYSIAKVAKTQEVKLTADYYRLSSTISTDTVQGIFEIILQEK